MKYLTALAILLCFIGPEGIGQTSKIMVKTSYSYEILDNGTPSEKRYPCIQKTYDSINRLVLERFYDIKAGKQVGFTWYFYNTNGRVKSIENYKMDRNPGKFKQIQYNDSGDTLKIVDYTGDRDTIAKTAEKVFYYAAPGLLKETKTLLPDKKLIERAKYYYKPGQASPVKITLVNKSSSPFKETMNFVYTDSTGLPQSAVNQVIKNDTKTNYVVFVTYNGKGNPVEEKYMQGGKLLQKKLYEYAANIELLRYFEEDSQGHKTTFVVVETFFDKAILNRKSYFE